MSDATRLADARYRKRCAVQGVQAALHELRVADARLAEIEGRAPRYHAPRLAAAHSSSPGSAGNPQGAHPFRPLDTGGGPAPPAASLPCEASAPPRPSHSAAESGAEGPAAPRDPAAGPERNFAQSGALGEAGGCAWCDSLPIREVLDGDALCQSCCDKWVRGEGDAALEWVEAGGAAPPVLAPQPRLDAAPPWCPRCERAHYGHDWCSRK